MCADTVMCATASAPASTKGWNRRLCSEDSGIPDTRSGVKVASDYYSRKICCGGCIGLEHNVYSDFGYRPLRGGQSDGLGQLIGGLSIERDAARRRINKADNAASDRALDKAARRYAAPCTAPRVRPIILASWAAASCLPTSAGRGQGANVRTGSQTAS